MILRGNSLDVLKAIKSESVCCVVTSPPYWGLRDYGCDGQLGLEKTPEEYIEKMVQVFREVKRVLKSQATCWINIGDSYASSPAGNFKENMPRPGDGGAYRENKPKMNYGSVVKPKDLCGIPWLLAFALRADGWYLRSDIIWAKPNPMPESVGDRPTKSHEYVFLLSKSARYFYDAEAVKEVAVEGTDLGLLRGRNAGGPGADKIAWHAQSIKDRQDAGVDSRTANINGTRNLRSVWTIATAPYSEAHFATFPPALAERCIKAGTSEKGICPGIVKRLKIKDSLTPEQQERVELFLKRKGLL